MQTALARVNALLGITQKQLQGVDLIEAGRIDDALSKLDSAEQDLDRIATGSAADRNQRGYDYKTYAQIFLKKGDVSQSKRYADMALNVFRQVRDDPKTTSKELARAIHRIGNIKHLRKDYDDAIDEYRLALAIFPKTPYGWHDLFLAYIDRAGAGGKVDLPAAQEAFQQARDNNDLKPYEIAALQGLLTKYRVRP